MINLRLNDARPYILDDNTDERFPLHPNYSTSVKVRGLYYHSTNYFGKSHIFTISASHRTTSRQLVDEFLAAVKADGRILLNLEGGMSWFLSVRYLTDLLTGEITTDQFAYIATFLNKWGMSYCNPCQLPLKPGQDLAQLPLDTTPDRKVIGQYWMLVGELMFFLTNTIPTIHMSSMLLRGI